MLSLVNESSISFMNFKAAFLLYRTADFACSTKHNDSALNSKSEQPLGSNENLLTNLSGIRLIRLYSIWMDFTDTSAMEMDFHFHETQWK